MTNDEIRCCGNCAFWNRAYVHDRGDCCFALPAWVSRGDDGDRTTHEDEDCSMHEFLEGA